MSKNVINIVQKPAVLQAIQWLGDNKEAIVLFTKNNVGFFQNNKTITIPTENGMNAVNLTDWIIKDPIGRFSTLTNEQFFKIYTLTTGEYLDDIE